MSHPFANNFYHPYYPAPENINYYYPANFPLHNQPHPEPFMMYPNIFNYPFYSSQPQNQNKIDSLSVKGTTDYERPQEPQQMQKPQSIGIKEQQQPQKQKEPYILAQNPEYQLSSCIQKPNMKKQKFKKNTQANVVNNIISFLCVEVKSHHVIKSLLIDKEKMKIFYIFMNNLKKLNNKYLNKKILEALLLLEPGSVYGKMLQKSVKRLQILPLSELRDVIRKCVFGYLRGHYSILPLFTSKKICRISMKHHLEKRRHMTEYLLEILKRNN